MKAFGSGMSRAAAAAVWRLVWLRGEPDPRILQLGFTVLLAAEAGLRVVGGIALSWESWVVRAVVLSALLTVLSWCVPGARRRTSISVIAILDIGVVGVALLSNEDGGLGLLVVLPALWLGRRYGEWGALVAVVASLVLVTVPGLTYHGPRGAGLTYLVMIPLIAGVSSLAISAGLEVARSAQARAERGESELARALETIKAHQHTSQAIFDAAGVGLMLLDRDGELLAMNHRYGEFVSLSLPDGTDLEWPGHCFAADGVTPLSADEVPSSRAARGEEFDDFLMWSGNDPRTRRAVSVSARHAEGEAGDFIGAALAGTDVTDLMRALAVKDEFIGLVSHELRTPLTSIYGYVSMLHEREDLPEIALKQIGVVARSADRLRILVDDLLEAAQVTSNGLSLDPGPVDLASIVAESIASARPHAADAGIVLEADLPTQAGLVGDQVRLAQVVDNLVSNAIKYTPRGGSVHVTLDERTDAVELLVRDTGMGIAPDDLDQVFNRFFRTQQAADQAIRGVGLGLAITKQIIEGHGGVIEVDSELGRGSEFRVVLPLQVIRLAS
ncbi:hypothetical protein ASC77_24000 [Nocardioides sp. Root1257]|uniref:ATP-binding protein n=1 Tax=unclassified Nocardioides TaxID=2615069 RepID=UPI0006FB36B1|nr:MULTISPECIES: ATP-binding protein [unclassified Nocardioides]KQW52454.1 hypothetical protein ASC77_24000 [Nocardioides sp. Root1257]KRC54517.1 hypothetical protein ASE24_23795 [Nocardioides sp. Root224]